MIREITSIENHSSLPQAFRIGKPGFLKSMLLKPTMLLLALLLFTQAAFAGQVTILAPVDNTNVDFEHLGMSVTTFSSEQLEEMDQETATSVKQSIEASVLVLTGAMMPTEAFANLFENDETRDALDGLFRRGGMFYLGQLSGGGYNNLPDAMRSYFEDKDVFIPRAGNRPSTSGTIGTFFAHANPELMDLPLLSQPNSLAEGTWRGVGRNAFYFRDFPDTALPILLGPEDGYPVMLLQQGILGEGKLIISQARDLTRSQQSHFWDNLIAFLGGDESSE
ncbi:hypothetical protein ACERK3_08095 [Phycisphaerales bacterium AB-hyl4]|uniref:DUF4159 domain-containing protein n=1 Tax=Natronomicrosphaera hydrolytica TaxID=3242702 RepID=A0ABV4U510_9BACT